MPLNIPSFTTNNISFGTARVFIAAVNTTPSTSDDIGAISEDGVTIEINNEKRYVTQGNPKVTALVFSQATDVTISFRSLEWNFDNFVRALSAGQTDSGGGGTISQFYFGADPTPIFCTMHIQHTMGVSGHTIDAYVWKACSDSSLTLPFIHDEHGFDMAFKAIRVTSAWDASTLTSQQQLLYITRTTA